MMKIYDYFLTDADKSLDLPFVSVFYRIKADASFHMVYDVSFRYVNLTLISFCSLSVYIYNFN